MNTNDAPEAQIVTRLREAEREVASLRAELAAVRAAVDGETVPADASELVRYVASLVGIETRYEEALARMGEMTEKEIRRDRAAEPEDDGLTDADRAAGWRWEAIGAGLFVRSPRGVLCASVTHAGWFAYPRAGDGDMGPETGAAGQRAAVRALRAAGVMPGGERSGT